MEPWFFTATEAVEAVRGKRVSRVEMAEAHFQRILAVNGSVNALVELRDREDVVAEAAAADRRAQRSPSSSPRLDGAIVSIKDHYDVTGMASTEGVRALADRRATCDSLVVQRLRASGALVIGKSNQPDFKVRWNTISDLYGATRNPRDLRLSAGGSSGGDAAAVAAGMAAVGVGGDYGGSIRVPASFCGVWGLRPSAGRIPQGGGGPPTIDLMASPGVLARSLADLRVSFDVLAGSHPSDPATVPAPLRRDRANPPGMHVARMSDETGAAVLPEVEDQLDWVARVLADGGYVVESGGLPRARRAPELWAELAGTELLRVAMPVWRDHLGDSARDHIEKMFGLFELGPSVERYIAAFMERGELAREAAAWMQQHPLIIAPVAGMQAPPLDFDHFLSSEATQRLFDHMRNVMWVNLLGLPSVALPNGIQIVARRFHEHEALAAAAIVADALAPIEPAEPDPSTVAL